MNEILFIPFIILLGFITSFEDLRKGLIRNKWIVLSLAYSLIAAALMEAVIHNNYFLNYLITLTLSFFYGILIYLSGLWSAGDSKLFIAYSALLPLFIFGNPHLSSFTLLVNTFVPIFFYFLIMGIFKTTLAQKIKVLRGLFDIKLLVSITLFLFSFSWIIRITFTFFNIPDDFFLMIFSLFVLLFIFEKFFPDRFLTLTIILTGLTLIFDYRSVNAGYLKILLTMILLFLFLRYFVLNLTYQFLTYPIYIEKLKPGMFLADNIVKHTHDELKTRSIVSISFIQNLLMNSDSKTVFGASAEGLTEEEVKEIQQLHNENRLREHTVRVYHTMAFAPLMFLGVLLTLVIKDNVVVFVLGLF